MTSLPTGKRIAQARRRRGISQRELAAAVCRSESWVSQVERGVLPVERLSVLQALADALGIPAHTLRPDLDEATEILESEDLRINDLDALRLALTGHPALEYLFGSQQRHLDIGELGSRVDAAWALTHADRYADLSTALPPLLADLEVAVRTAPDPADRSSLSQHLARAYQAAAAAFARQDEADAAWLAADRGIRAAEAAGSPLWVLAGHFRMAHAFIRLQRFDQAEHATLHALQALEPEVNGNHPAVEALSLYGALHLVTAVLRAREGNRGAAREHLDAASRTATRLGADRDDFGTEFGPTNVLLHRVSIAIDLGDAGEALEVAENVDASALSAERQARFWLDVARAHAQRRHVGSAIEALLTAERLSPEMMRGHQLSRDTIATMLRTGTGSDELKGLAERAGVDV